MFAIRSTQRPSTPSLAAWLMNSRLVPRVYEAWWRPALGFVATAGRHTSMSQEYAAAAEALHLGPGATVVDLACGTGAFTRAARALRAGGRIAIFTSARHGSRPWRDLDGAIGSIGGLRMFERDEVRELLARHGFTDIDRRIEGVTQTVSGTRRTPAPQGDHS